MIVTPSVDAQREFEIKRERELSLSTLGRVAVLATPIVSLLVFLPGTMAPLGLYLIMHPGHGPEQSRDMLAVALFVIACTAAITGAFARIRIVSLVAAITCPIVTWAFVAWADRCWSSGHLNHWTHVTETPLLAASVAIVVDVIRVALAASPSGPLSASPKEEILEAESWKSLGKWSKPDVEGDESKEMRP